MLDKIYVLWNVTLLYFPKQHISIAQQSVMETNHKMSQWIKCPHKAELIALHIWLKSNPGNDVAYISEISSCYLNSGLLKPEVSQLLQPV